VKRSNNTAMFISGGMAGMAGCIMLMSVQSRLIHAFAKEIGFSGVAVALLGNNTAVGMTVAAVLFAGLEGGASKMQTLANIPNAVVYMMQGVILLFVSGKEIFQSICRPFAKQPFTEEVPK